MITRHLLKGVCTSCMAIAVLFIGSSTDAVAQDKKIGQRDGTRAPGRPDRRFIDASPKNVLPKFKESRKFGGAEGTEEYRTYNGTFNNLTNPRAGSIFIDLLRLSPPAYGPGNSLARQDQPSARVISNTVCSQNATILNDRNLTDFVWQWGQFMDHDLDLTEFNKLPVEPANIPVALGDPIFDPANLGGQSIGFNRSLFRRRVFVFNQVRQQLNEITAWIDASNVYGSDEERANELRTFEDGKLLTSDEAGLFLPVDPPVANGNPVFIAGDIRSTEQVGLATMHTLFMREHNRLCDEILEDDTGLSDEEVYQMARKEVYSILESITYNEWLPALLGPDNALAEYTGYDPSVNPNIANEFSGCAFRFGHTMLNNQLLRLNDDGSSIGAGPVLLKDTFFNADVLLDFGVEPYLKGLMTQQTQEVDAKFINAVRNFLFVTTPDATQGPDGPIGLDLAALNFQRGRDHGIGGINTIRIALDLEPYESFEEFISDPLTRAQFQSVYDNVDDVDPLLAMLAEEHVSNSSLGETLSAVIKDQFERVRDGDRFWYENILTGEDLDRINNTTLADIIRRNTTLTNVPDNVFVAD